MRYEYDEEKNRKNKEKHGVEFWQAAEVFEDPYRIEAYDQAHSSLEEERWQVIGKTKESKTLFVVFTEKIEGSIRLVSASVGC
mgnify:CR=1 FL=1